MSSLLRFTTTICRASGVRGLSSVSAARPLASLRADSFLGQPKPLESKVRPLGLLGSQFCGLSTSSALRSSQAHDHSKVWTLERILSLALLPSVPLSIAYPNILFDTIVSVAVVMHVHWGVEAVVVDYVRPIIFGKIIPKLSLGLVYIFSVVLLLGLLNLTFRGQGIGNSVNTLWSM